MSSVLQLNKLPLLRRKPGIAELNQVLELIPRAVLVIESRSRDIISANILACKLLHLSPSAIQKENIDTYLRHPNGTRYQIESDGNLDSDIYILKRKDGTESEIKGIITSFKTSADWYVLTLIPETETAESILPLSIADFQESHQHLLMALSESKLTIALSNVLKSIQIIFAAENIAIYQVSSQQTELRSLVSIGDSLPPKLPPQSLILARQEHYWSQSTKPKGRLQEVARDQNFAYLASNPIGTANATIGLLVIGGFQPLENQFSLDILPIMANIVNHVIQRYASFQNIKSNLDRQRRFRDYVETVQNAIEDCIIVLSKDLRIIQMNRSAELALGYMGSEAQNFYFDDIIIGTDNLRPDIQSAVEIGQPVKHRETHLFRRSGESFLARVSSLPVVVEDNVEGVIILIRDMSEHEYIQAQAQLLEQQASLGEVMAIFAHEVRNPINNLSTGLQLMAYNMAAEDPNQDIITRLQSDCDRLEAQMKSVLAFSRPTDYEMDAVDIGLLINRLSERLKPRMAPMNIELLLQITPDLPPVHGDHRPLEQVFSNLINNAMQAMKDQGGTIAIRVSHGENYGDLHYIEINIADNGPGIPRENLDKVFLPFFTTRSKGTGLGLAITKRIITAHRGNISVDSFPGGTVFKILLPVAMASNN